MEKRKNGLQIKISSFIILLILMFACSASRPQLLMDPNRQQIYRQKSYRLFKIGDGFRGQTLKEIGQKNQLNRHLIYRFIDENRLSVENKFKKKIQPKKIYFQKFFFRFDQLDNNRSYYQTKINNKLDLINNKKMSKPKQGRFRKIDGHSAFQKQQKFMPSLHKDNQNINSNSNKKLKQYQQNNKNLIYSKYNKATRKLQVNNQNSSKEYIMNNQFKQRVCGWFYCDWNLTNFKSHFIPYWEPYPDIEIGLANYYNPFLGFGYVLQLVRMHPTCVRQLISNIPSGIYDLKYVYAPHGMMSLASSQIFVYFNESKVDQKKAINYRWHTAIVSKIRIQNNNTSIYIKFCGNKTLIRQGVVIGEVSLKRSGNLEITVPNNGTNFGTHNQDIENNDNQTMAQSNDNSTQQTLEYDPNPNNQQEAIIQSTINQQNYQNNANPINFDFSRQNQTMNYFNGTQGFFSDAEYIQYLLGLASQVMSNSVAIKMLQSSILRKIFSKGFSFFINIDHLWLYNFHKRPFFTKIVSILIVINELESSKWGILPLDIENQYLDFPQIKNSLNQKLLYTPEESLNVQYQSRSFLIMTFKFFIIYIPFVIVIFFIGKLLHRFFSKYSFVQIFKEFGRNSFLIIILLQGNSESFTYFLISDLLTMFSLKLKMKVLNIFSVIVFFNLIFLLVALPFILRYLYQKKKYLQFYDKCKNNLRGSVFFMAEFGLFNITLGSIHILCENEYKMQLVLLLTAEFLFLIYTVSNFYGRRKVLSEKLTIWIMLWASLIRMVFILSFISTIHSSEQFLVQLDKVQEDCILFYLLLLLASLVHWVSTVIIKIGFYIYCKVEDLLRRNHNKTLKRKNKIVVKDQKVIIKIQKLKNLDHQRYPPMGIKQRKLQQKVKNTLKINKKEHLKGGKNYLRQRKLEQELMKIRKPQNVSFFQKNKVVYIELIN